MGKRAAFTEEESAARDGRSSAGGADATGRRCAKQVVQEGWGGGIGLVALLVLGALLVAPVLALREFAPREMWPWLAGGAALVSLIAFGLYALDKRRARRGQWRVPESSLHFWALIGGWPGAFLAQRLLRHKSSKFSFQFGFWLIVAIHHYLAIDALLGWRLFRAARLGLGELLRKVIDL